MYINGVSYYLPQCVVPNSAFLQLNGLEDEWIYSRTGIKERRYAAPEENANTMAIEAVMRLIQEYSVPVSEIDLIIGASYSPHDTVVTVGHEIQKKLNIDAVTFWLSSACSSLLNSIEIVQGYFAMNKAKHALVIASEKNSAYSKQEDRLSGHLWGDGATALWISKEPCGDLPLKVLDITTLGLGHIGESTRAVYLNPQGDGLVMPNGRDIFFHASTYMSQVLQSLLERQGFVPSDLTYVIAHQANGRIVQQVAKKLYLPKPKMLTCIEKTGNTGSASCGICYCMHKEKIKKGDSIGFTVFGGGYSAGAMIVRAV